QHFSDLVGDALDRRSALVLVVSAVRADARVARDGRVAVAAEAACVWRFAARDGDQVLLQRVAEQRAAVVLAARALLRGYIHRHARAVLPSEAASASRMSRMRAW